MQPDEDEEAWRSIVDNYGDRAELEEDASDKPEPPTAVFRFEPPVPPPETDEVDRFVAPDPPLPPRPTRDRQAAWAGLFGAPIVLLVLIVAGVHIPSLLAYAMVIGFVGGFLYLVFHLPRAPEDPFDDGARL